MKTLSPAARQALAARQHKSIKETRAKLEAALLRIVEGKTKVVPKNARVSPLSVCKEAAVDRSTLYRFHEPVLAEIHRLNQATPRAQLKEKQSDLARMNEKLKEYRQLTERAQSETESLARINYRLQARVTELEELLRARDEVIRRYARPV